MRLIPLLGEDKTNKEITALLRIIVREAEPRQPKVMFDAISGKGGVRTTDSRFLMNELPVPCARGVGESQHACYNRTFTGGTLHNAEDSMAEIFPFHAIRYDARRVPLDCALTQPYDKITSEMQARYYAASSYNLISIEKGKTLATDSTADNAYTRASRALEDWLAQGILVRDATPAIYVYFQDFALPGTTRPLQRRGFIALGRLADYDEGVVFRHERTLTAPKADRLELLRHTRAQTGQLFLLYDDPSRRVDALLEESAKAPPAAEVTDEFGVIHRLWAITDAAKIERIAAAMAAQKLVIADGHHRYETALAYRDECRAKAARKNPDAAYERAMWTCFNICQDGRQDGIKILPTHRVVRNLPGFSVDHFLKAASAYFNWYSYPFTSTEERLEAYADFSRDLAGRGRAGHVIGMYAAGTAFYLLVLRDGRELERWLPDVSPAQRQLDVVLLHRLLLENCLGVTAERVAAEANVSYEREMDAAIADVDSGAAQVAFLLNAVRVKQVTDLALAGEVLPQKSTDFYPKLLSGLCIYRLE
ncbi:MAG TPA: DUF1015 domain-containing protein [Candidatus Acidoferrales bacterium]|nr:DUF1015 domain-containing protein [Candidatus Acidoferrales bacterium]